MLSIALKCEVPRDRTLVLHLPEEIEPGQHEVLVVIDRVQAQTVGDRRRPGSAFGKLVIKSEDDAHLVGFEDYIR